MFEKLRVLPIISGGGTTFEAITIAILTGVLKRVKIVGLVCTNRHADGLRRARHLGFGQNDVLVCPLKEYPDENARGEAIIQFASDRQADVIGLYGCLAHITDNVLQAFPNAVVNQHPGYINGRAPGFGGDGMYGARVHAATLYFARHCNRLFPWTACVSHRVVPQTDTGPVLRMQQVPIYPDDTPETLAARVLPWEYSVQIDTLRDFAEGTVRELKIIRPLILPGEEELLAEAKKHGIGYKH